MTPEQEIHRAGEARHLLETTLFQEAKADLERKLAQLRQSVPIGQTDMHTRLILMEQIMGQFFGYFEQLAQTGRFAELHLAREESRRKSLLDNWALFRTSGRNAF